MQGVCNVEHVFAVALPALSKLLREELLHDIEAKELVVEALHRQLIVSDDVHKLDLLELEQFLLASEDLFRKIFCEHLERRHIVLQRVSCEFVKTYLQVILHVIIQIALGGQTLEDIDTRCC